MTKEELQAIREILHEELEPINKRLKNIEEDVAILKEDSAITRAGVNTLLEWAEEAQIQVKIPLFKKAE